MTIPGVRQQALLARLLLAAGAPVGPWELRHDVWHGRQKSDAALRVAVMRLRTLLAQCGAPDAIRRTGEGYLLDRSAVQVDADTFRVLVGDAHRFSHGDPAAALVAADEALALWRGPAFGEIRDEEFIQGEAERLNSLWRDVVEVRLAALVDLGIDGLVPELEAAVADTPLRERRTALLMIALYRAGRQAEALAVYRRLEMALRDDLGLLPSDELRVLDLRILRQDPELLCAAAARRGPVSVPVRDGADVHAALGRARSAQAIARAGLVEESGRVAAEAVASARALDDATLAECLVAAAQAWALGGRAADAAAALDEAAALARRVGDGRVLARAALARFGFGMTVGDDLLAELMEPLELLALDSPLRVDLLCGAMHQTALQGGVIGARRLLAQAESAAATIGDERSRAVVLAGRAVLAGVEGATPDVLRAAADEAVAAAEASGDATLVVAALHSAARATLQAGDLVGMEEVARRMAMDSTASLFPFAVVRAGLLAGTLRLARGELDGLEEHLAEVEATGRRLGVASSPGTTQAQGALLALERGRFAELAELTALLATSGTGWAGVRALVLAELGCVEKAVALARPLVMTGCQSVATMPHDEREVVAIMVGEVAVLARDAELAAAARILLAPLRGRFATLAHATLTLGPIDRVLGLLDLTTGDAQSGVEELRAAVALADQAPLWRARARLGLAGALQARNEPGDVIEAAALLDDVASSAVADPARGGSTWLAAQLRRAAAQPAPA